MLFSKSGPSLVYEEFEGRNTKLQVDFDVFGVIEQILVKTEYGMIKVDLEHYELRNSTHYLYIQERVNEALTSGFGKGVVNE